MTIYYAIGTVNGMPIEEAAKSAKSAIRRYTAVHGMRPLYVLTENEILASTNRIKKVVLNDY